MRDILFQRGVLLRMVLLYSHMQCAAAIEEAWQRLTDLTAQNTQQIQALAQAVANQQMQSSSGIANQQMQSSSATQQVQELAQSKVQQQAVMSETTQATNRALSQQADNPQMHSSCYHLLSKVIGMTTGYCMFTLLHPIPAGTTEHALCIDPYSIVLLLGPSDSPIALLALMVDFNIQMQAKFVDKLNKNRAAQRPLHAQALTHITPKQYTRPGQISILNMPMTHAWQRLKPRLRPNPKPNVLLQSQRGRIRM